MINYLSLHLKWKSVRLLRVPGAVGFSVMSTWIFLPELAIGRSYWINRLSGFTAVIYETLKLGGNLIPLCQLLLLNSLQKEHHILNLKSRLCYHLTMEQR